VGISCLLAHVNYWPEKSISLISKLLLIALKINGHLTLKKIVFFSCLLIILKSPHTILWHAGVSLDFKLFRIRGVWMCLILGFNLFSPTRAHARFKTWVEWCWPTQAIRMITNKPPPSYFGSSFFVRPRGR
jgi:hypothetical protein